MTYSYYMIMRPPMPGAMPKTGLTDIKEYSGREYRPEIKREAWALITYDRKLTEKEIRDYELIPEPGKATSRKVLGIKLDGCQLECDIVADKNNPFRVYKIGSGHKRQIAKYGDFMSVLCFLVDFYRAGADTFSMHDLIAWAKEIGSIY